MNAIKDEGENYFEYEVRGLLRYNLPDPVPATAQVDMFNLKDHTVSQVTAIISEDLTNPLSSDSRLLSSLRSKLDTFSLTELENLVIEKKGLENLSRDIITRYITSQFELFKDVFMKSIDSKDIPPRYQLKIKADIFSAIDESPPSFFSKALDLLEQEVPQIDLFIEHFYRPSLERAIAAAAQTAATQALKERLNAEQLPMAILAGDRKVEDQLRSLTLQDLEKLARDDSSLISLYTGDL